MEPKPWRDPEVFVELEALIEVGLGDHPQCTLRPKQIRSAVRIYRQRHPNCDGQYIRPEHKQSQEEILRLQVCVGLKSRAQMMLEKRRQDVARKAALVRWIIRQGSQHRLSVA